jgi:hypothetical protein
MTLDEEKKYVQELTLFWKQKWQALHTSPTVTLTRDDTEKLHDTATHLHALCLLVAAQEQMETSVILSDKLLKQTKSVLMDVLKIKEVASNRILRARIERILTKLDQ